MNLIKIIPWQPISLLTPNIQNSTYPSLLINQWRVNSSSVPFSTMPFIKSKLSQILILIFLSFKTSKRHCSRNNSKWFQGILKFLKSKSGMLPLIFRELKKILLTLWNKPIQNKNKRFKDWAINWKNNNKKMRFLKSWLKSWERNLIWWQLKCQI